MNEVGNNTPDSKNYTISLPRKISDRNRLLQDEKN
jgi:hypothetical protein